jgi:hypothetical protein
MKAIAVFLIGVLVSQPFIATAQTPEETRAAIKEQVVVIPSGKIIEVELLQKGGDKIKGKLISVADEGFVIQSASSGKIFTQNVAFSEVKSVKKIGMSVGKKMLIGVGVWFGVMLIIFAAAHA